MPDHSEMMEIFLAEANEQFEQLNKLLTDLEKEPDNHLHNEAAFRILHTLKANAAAMRLDGISETAHILEDIFSAVRKDAVTPDESLFSDLFRATDKLGELLKAVGTNTKVSYKGLVTKLKVKMRRAGVELSERSTSLASADTAPEKETESTSSGNALRKESSSEDNTANDSSSQSITFSDLIQIPVRKLDNLLTLVGELVIERDRLMNNAKEQSGDTSDFTSLYRLTADLQYSVMDVRLVRISVMFNKFHRIVRDVAKKEGKPVNLQLIGTEVEIDRTVLRIISESMIHLVRNAVSHGIELPEIRKERGKPENGSIVLEASGEKDSVTIQVRDDGAGIDIERIRKKVIEKGLRSKSELELMNDEQIMMFIFEPGFSSIEKVTSISGRGVGMDVVSKAVHSIGGSISMESAPGQGTSFTLTLPASMAVKDVLLFELNNREFGLPLSFTESVFSVNKDDIHAVGSGLMASYQEKMIPIIFLNDLFSLASLKEVAEGDKAFQQSWGRAGKHDKMLIIVVRISEKFYGIVVDKLLQRKEIIEKPLRKPLEKMRFANGTTILGNGRVCLILDVPELVHFVFQENRN